MAAAFGMKNKIDEATEQVFGRLPAGLEMPIPKLSRWRLLKEIVPLAYRAKKRVQKNQEGLSLFLEQAPKHTGVLRDAVRKTEDGVGLVQVWNHLIESYFRNACQMLQAAGKLDSTALVEMRKDLRIRVGETDANTILTGLQSGGNELASLGPLIGLTKVARGEMSRDEYAQMYGHRGAHEFELSMPRPAEDPEWIDKQIAGLDQAQETLATLLARKETERNAAWARLEARSPREVAKIRKNVDRWAFVARTREFARSESIRCFWVARAFVLRAGEITGKGPELFFLSIDEILALLSGDSSALAHVPARRATYEAYAALPSYPTLIRGAFDPFNWAREPNRRSDLFDVTATAPPASATITGFPGSIGIVEGLVRVISTPEEGAALQTGEILVTTVTNIGWTPLFPRAAAVVTDVGAPLSHAAIVARELGIPAVVGCGNATMRLRTGDRVRVDGQRGVVELLERAATI
jgi:pyruvate,water dikinase